MDDVQYVIKRDGRQEPFSREKLVGAVAGESHLYFL